MITAAIWYRQVAAFFIGRDDFAVSPVLASVTMSVYDVSLPLAGENLESPLAYNIHSFRHPAFRRTSVNGLFMVHPIFLFTSEGVIGIKW